MQATNITADGFNYTKNYLEISLDQTLSLTESTILNIITHNINIHGTCFLSNIFLARLVKIKPETVKNVLTKLYKKCLLSSYIKDKKRFFQIPKESKFYYLINNVKNKLSTKTNQRSLYNDPLSKYEQQNTKNTCTNNQQGSRCSDSKGHSDVTQTYNINIYKNKNNNNAQTNQVIHSQKELPNHPATPDGVFTTTKTKDKESVPIASYEGMRYVPAVKYCCSTNGQSITQEQMQEICYYIDSVYTESMRESPVKYAYIALRKIRAGQWTKPKGMFDQQTKNEQDYIKKHEDAKAEEISSVRQLKSASDILAMLKGKIKTPYFGDLQYTT